jgi:hypothetical protein
METLLRLKPLLASFVLYAGALAFPGFYVIRGNEPSKQWIEGFWLLAFGPFAVPQGIFAWLANPLLFAAWISFARQAFGKAVAFSVAALVFALTFHLHQGSSFHDGSGMNTFGSAAPGYWLWIASLLTALLAAGAASRSSKSIER